MRCPSCRSGSGALIDMAPANGKLACPACGATVGMVDLGYSPFLVQKAEPSPFRVPSGREPITCGWCERTFVPEGSQTIYCSEVCGVEADAAKTKARRKAARDALFASAGVAADQGWHHAH